MLGQERYYWRYPVCFLCITLARDKSGTYGEFSSLSKCMVAAKGFFVEPSYFPDKVDSIVKGKMIIPIEGYLPPDLYYAAVPVILTVPGRIQSTASSSVHNMNFI